MNILRAAAKSFSGRILNCIHSTEVNYAHVSLRAHIGRGCSISAGVRMDALSSLGPYSFIGHRSTVSRATIGAYASLGANVSVGPGEHPLNRVATSSIFYDGAFDVLTHAPCELGNDVWVGVDSIVLRGVRVGNGAIVGANSVVTRDVEPFAVVAGSPAKTLRFRFDERTRRLIEESAWWTLDIVEARLRLAEIASAITTDDGTLT